MTLIVVKENLTEKDLNKAREHYEFYIKITADLKQKIVVIGGEYHADAEKLLLENYHSAQENIWGGGFNLKTKKFETNAVINIRTNINENMEILDPQLRKEFLDLVHKRFKGIDKLI